MHDDVTRPDVLKILDAMRAGAEVHASVFRTAFWDQEEARLQAEGANYVAVALRAGGRTCGYTVVADVPLTESRVVGVRERTRDADGMAAFLAKTLCDALADVPGRVTASADWCSAIEEAAEGEAGD